MALALYRRYRPDSFEGVIGQDQVTVPLMRALDNNKLTHAYLFSGPRGCGKTSSARILARCINCEQGPTSTPCGECASCKDLATGGPGSIDVVEIDAASHNGVDDARELRERAGFAPAQDRYKIFILDEAHMVTQQGFNALLKIVEEPPEHVMFIFATTEPDKVIGTIRSRTHHYPFRLVPQEVMGPYLQQLCEQEGITAEPGVLRLAMRAGGGSVRDTLSVLDQLMAGAVEGAIPYDAAVALLGFTPDMLINDAFDAIVKQDGAALYEVIQKVVVGGFDARRFVEDLLAHARDLLVLQLAGNQADHVLGEDTAADIEQMRAQSQAIGLQALTSLAQTIDSTLSQMQGAVSARMRLELLAARLLAQGDASQEQPAASFKQVEAPAVAKTGGFRPRREAASRERTGASASVAESPKLPAAKVEQQPQQASSTANPDVLWDSLVRSLPEDVRGYVDRTHVPRILFDVKPQGKRLWIKFDTPMSKYAFALGVAKESIGGQTSVVSILRDKVHTVFGADVVLTPTKKMANGEVAPPFKQLDPARQQQIKSRLVMERLGQSVGSTPAVTNNSDGRQPHDGQPDTQQSDDSGQAASQTPIPGLPQDDPWANAQALSAPPIDFNRMEQLDERKQQMHDSSQRFHASMHGPDQTSATGEQPSNGDVWQQVPAADSAESKAPVPEQVDAARDVYSMDDASLDEAQSIAADELNTMFDVKSVEEFAADDPRNPVNAQHRQVQRQG